MSELLFSTTDTTVEAGRARVIAALNAQAAAVGLADLFPEDAADHPHVHLEVPGSVIASKVPQQYRAAISADTVVIDTSDGLITRPDGETAVVTGYYMDLLIELRHNRPLGAALMGILSARWTAKATSQRSASADELKLDPGRPATITWKESDGVRMQIASPRQRKHRFAGV